MSSATRAIAVAGLGILSACVGGPDYRDETKPITTVAAVDLERYAGTWYEIARYEQTFQRGCTNVTATYGLRDDGAVSVTNRCVKNDKESVAEGVARPVPDTANAKLRVRFAPAWIPFAEGDYWVLALDEDYTRALVGAPSGQYLWLLSRQPDPPQADVDALLAAAVANGFNTEPLLFTQTQGTAGQDSD